MALFQRLPESRPKINTRGGGVIDTLVVEV